MRHVLEGLDECWEVIEAEDGLDAVAKAQESRPNLVILDLAMPQADGLTASRALAKLLPDVPILMHTLYSSPEVELEAGKVGVRKVVPKSESSVLVSAIQDILGPKPSTPSAASPPLDSAIPEHFRRTEDKIRELCNQLFAQTDDKVQAPIIVELRRLLHEHIQQLRARVAAFPVIERRVRVGFASPANLDPISLDPTSNEAIKNTKEPSIAAHDEAATSAPIKPPRKAS
jgi:CheY-like chemotaxis protein